MCSMQKAQNINLCPIRTFWLTIWNFRMVTNSRYGLSASCINLPKKRIFGCVFLHLCVKIDTLRVVCVKK